MKILRTLAVAGGILFGAAGCATVTELPAEKITGELKTPELQLCRELLIAFVKDDASGFVSRLTPENRKSFDREEFANARKSMLATIGEPVSFRYLTTLEFVKLQPHVFVVRFKRENRKGEQFFSEALFRIVTGRDKNGEIYILGFNFL